MTLSSSAPKSLGPLARKEASLARRMLFPSITVVALIVLFPLLANFWISFKPITLSELRPPTVLASERVKVTEIGFTTEYRLRNSSRTEPITEVVVVDRIESDWQPLEIDPNCAITGNTLRCALDQLAPGERIKLFMTFAAPDEAVGIAKSQYPEASGKAKNVLTNLEFTLENFANVFSTSEFWAVLKVSFYYTIFGTLGAIVLGLFAALLLDRDFKGRGVLRGIFLFPYVAPVIAVAFAWIILLDPFSGSVNTYMKQAGLIEGSINFLGARSADISLFGMTFKIPLALTTVITFEAWRYFPLSFLFILARMQSINTEMYDAAKIDGASPMQVFRYISLPQLLGIMSVLFLLRFIWTFNKFDDIFLLTGGGAGTRTLVVSVYEQAFAVSNLGAGAAVAVVVFCILLSLSVLFFRLMPSEEM